MKLGKPITIINGGISPVRIVISYPNQPIVPKEKTTAIATTATAIRVAEYDLKNRKKIKAVINIAKYTKLLTSLIIVCELKVRI